MLLSIINPFPANFFFPCSQKTFKGMESPAAGWMRMGRVVAAELFKYLAEFVKHSGKLLVFS